MNIPKPMTHNNYDKIVIRGKKKKKEDKDEDREGILSDAGAF